MAGEVGHGRLPRVCMVKRQKVLSISELESGRGSRARSSVARRHRVHIYIIPHICCSHLFYKTRGLPDANQLSHSVEAGLYTPADKTGSRS